MRATNCSIWSSATGYPQLAKPLITARAQFRSSQSARARDPLAHAGYVLICLSGKRDPTLRLRQINTTGKSLLIFRNRVKPKNQKYSTFVLTQISRITPPVSPD
jgi:hypothetical protein